MNRHISTLTISRLMLLVLILGIELTAITSHSTLGHAMIFNLTIAVLIYASFAARFGRDGAAAW